MRSTPLFALLSPLLFAGTANLAHAVSDATNGDWTQQQVTLKNTTEAALMARVGDINNFGFGWPSGFDPFSGNSTPSHNYPWTVPSGALPGLDRIMVVSSFNGKPPRRPRRLHVHHQPARQRRPGNHPEL